VIHITFDRNTKSEFRFAWSVFSHVNTNR